MIEIIKRLRQLKGILRNMRRLSRGYGARYRVIGLRRSQQHLPEILRTQLAVEGFASQVTCKNGERLAPFGHLSQDVARPHCRVLHVGACLTLETQRLLKIEGN